MLDEGWGSGISAELFAQSLKDDPRFRELLGRIERASGSPRTIREVIDGLIDTDVRAAANAISVPTLVIHTTDDIAIPIENGRWLADHIPNARFVEMPGEHVAFDADRFGDEVESFLSDGRPVTTPTRVLSTVMFSDIVGSTEKASAMGDRQWRELLDAHDILMRREIETSGGRLVKTTGDGVMATFDGPARGVECGRRLLGAVEPLGIDIRVGLHTGEVEIRGEDIGGIAVHIAARVSAEAGARQVLVSRTVTDLVAGSGLEFEDQGEHSLKGVSGAWHLYSAVA